MSKIRVIIRKPRRAMPDVPSVHIWNVSGIDEFAERFIHDANLVVNKYQLPVRNFIKHDERTATFDEISWTDFAEIELALGEIGLHNIRVDSIDDNHDPLKYSIT